MYIESYDRCYAEIIPVGNYSLYIIHYSHDNLKLMGILILFSTGFPFW